MINYIQLNYGMQFLIHACTSAVVQLNRLLS